MPDKINVLITMPFTDSLLKRFKEVSGRLHIQHRPARTYTDIIADIWGEAEILYTSSVFPPSEAAPKLKWIQLHSAGVDHAIGQSIIQQNENLQVTTTRGLHATNISEYILGMILALGHHYPRMTNDQLRREWNHDRDRYQPLELRGATVGIIGYGAIGRETARLVKAFGGRVLAAKHNAKEATERESFTYFEGTGDPEGEMFDRLYPPQALATMVKDCHFVVNTMPLTESTHHLMDERIFRAMKKGAYVINIGRGSTVDEAALIEALQDGHLGGAALDVFEQEPLPAESPLWTMPNVIISPHIAGISKDYNRRAAEVFIENLRRYLDGEPLLNTMSRSTGY
jgi:phosphoglycerate dehydrogenase-like enzyme